MMRKKTILAFLMAFFVLTFSQAKVHADLSHLSNTKAIKDVKKSGVLRVGVKQDVPNFGYYSADSKSYEGMEVDIARKIAASLKVKPEFTAVTAQTREALLDNGQLDMIIATYTITPERQKNYSFSKPYYLDEVGFLVNKDSHITSIKDLDGKVIGVAQGSTTKTAIEAYGKEHGLNFSFTQLGSYPELAISLYSKRIAAFSVDKSILTGYTSKKTKILTDGFNQQAYGIASKKDKHDLTRYINSLINQWSKDGTLDKIYRTHHLKPAKAKH